MNSENQWREKMVAKACESKGKQRGEAYGIWKNGERKNEET